LLALPIDQYLQAIADALRHSRALVISAAPGAGKTTRVPPTLLRDGALILLQPRRVAARAVAERIASERGWTLGREVGWHVRFDRRASADTRLLVATEGILTAHFQRDPLLSEFQTIVLDEFHERNIHTDLAIAFAKQAWLARSDLRIVIMSATLDTGRVTQFLNGCPVMEIPGRLHPIDIRYEPGRTVCDSACDLLNETTGSVLCFLPGAAEIARTSGELKGRLPGIDVAPLHGSLSSSEQHASLAPPTSHRRIIVATNIAETSLTVPGVTAVVDAGLEKVARYDSHRGIDSLQIERITQDSADQRAGRAGRIEPGQVRRLWDERDRLRPHREPEIARVDLAGPLLDVLARGGRPESMEWFEPPTTTAVDAAMALLRRLGALDASGMTTIGRRMQRLPLHPRLSRMLIAGQGAPAIARACALLSERHFLPRKGIQTSSDLLSALDQWNDVPSHVHRVAREVEMMAASILRDERGSRTNSPEADLLRAVFEGYPDRVAKRRQPGSRRVKLASGAGAVVGAESGVNQGDFLVAVDVQQRSDNRSIEHNPDEDVIVRIASRVDQSWLEPLEWETVHAIDSGVVRASTRGRYGSIVVEERPAAVDSIVASDLLVTAWIERGPDDADRRLLQRAQFARIAIDTASILRTVAARAISLDSITLRAALPVDVQRALDRIAPERLPLPSGRSVDLEYRGDGRVTAAAKLQELFGLAETPVLGPDRTPVTLALLAPNGRPVQVTQDLRSFWNRTYPEVRKELRGRYPRHPWPEDPWTATPSARTTRRASRR